VADVEIDVNDPVQALATSPSGDRVFVLAGDREAVRVIDRFTGDIVARVKLPGAGTALRSDPLGRVLLVQGAADSVWLVDVGTSSFVGTLRSAWRADLPAVLPDGAVALVQGDSITLASSLDRGVVRSMPAVASQVWYPMRWNGFRPRARGIDEPVRFRGSGDNPRSVGAPSLGGDSLAPGASVPGAAGDSAARESARTSEPSPNAASPSPGFTVQFAAVLSEEIAREAAAAVQVDGRTPRITSTVRDGRTVYRVVLGPFPTREEAERVGRASGRSYWVFEGAP
jgi:cell division septation protein DedD